MLVLILVNYCLHYIGAGHNSLLRNKKQKSPSTPPQPPPPPPLPLRGCPKLSCHVAALQMPFMNYMKAWAPHILTSLHSCNKEGIMNVEQGLGLHQLLGLTQLLGRQHLDHFCRITDSCNLLTTVPKMSGKNGTVNRMVKLLLDAYLTEFWRGLELGVIFSILFSSSAITLVNKRP